MKTGKETEEVLALLRQSALTGLASRKRTIYFICNTDNINFNNPKGTEGNTKYGGKREDHEGDPA